MSSARREFIKLIVYFDIVLMYTYVKGDINIIIIIECNLKNLYLERNNLGFRIFTIYLQK